ncbi:MAG: class I SAM-dependent methyltransferase [Oscillospiraceae bacterium]|nr:class I SAM-dependent methyltransferase [Oscillospiraceae bacterium]
MNAYGPLASFYDQLTEDVDYRGLYAYLMWHFNSGGVNLRRVLDMACGTGSLSMQFAARGVETIGMDLSEEMLTRAREKAESSKGPAPEFCRANMCDFSVPEPVDGLVCMLDSFNYLTDPADGICALICFYEALAPGGMLIFDVRPRRQLMAFDGQIFMDETDDVCCIWRTEFDESENICFYGMDLFIREGDLWKRSREEHYEYGYRLRWLKKEMEKIGFREIRFYGDRTMAPPTERDERVFITARKE